MNHPKAAADIKPKWGDQDDTEEELGQEITTEAEIDEDGSVRKTVVEYKTNPKGQKVQVIKKIRSFKVPRKVNKRVEERRKWRKFGECAGAPPGPEKGVTIVGDEVFFDSVNKSKKAAATKDGSIVTLVVCRNCGKTGDHWTLKCPYKSIPQPVPLTSSTDSLPSSSGSKYIPPRARGRTGEGETVDSRSRLGRDETATIRVTNLSEDTKESDLLELFRNFGQISRVYLAKDKYTGVPKGFAFINFVYREDAARAIEKLSGFGYDHLILHLEWARPSNK